MSYKEKWSKYRSQSKVERSVGLKKLLQKVDDIDDHQKLSDLIDIYLDGHDVITKIGLEIAVFTDKYNS